MAMQATPANDPVYDPSDEAEYDRIHGMRGEAPKYDYADDPDTLLDEIRDGSSF